MTGLDETVRFIRFVEKISHGDKVEIKEVWIITTNKYISTETLWKIIHSRLDIENNGFHQLKGEWHLNHCFLHSPTGVDAILIFIQVAFNLGQLFSFRCMRNFRDKKLLQTNIVDDIRDELVIFNEMNQIIMNST